MGRRKERLIDLLLRERLGGKAPPDLSRRIMGAIDNERAPGVRRLPPPVPPRAGFSPWMGIAASVALVAAVVLGAVAYNVSQGSADDPVEVAAPEVNRADTEQHWEENQRQAPLEKPERDPVPTDEPPRQVESPRAEPEPEPRPDRDPVVEEPSPETKPDTGSAPDSPDPEVRPRPDEDPAGDPVVEDPDRRPDTETTPEPRDPATPEQRPASLGRIVFATRGAALEIQGAGEDWRAFNPDGETTITAGARLRARRPVALELDDGARVYFDGEIAVDGDSERLDVVVEDESVFFDVYGSAREFTARRGELSLSFRDAEVVVKKSGLRLRVSCLGGEVTVGDVTLRGGWEASLTDSGFRRTRFRGERLRANPLVTAMDNAFVLMREELNENARARLVHGDWDDGIVRGRRAPDGDYAFSIDLEEELTVQERAYVRMRIRLADSEGFNIGFKSTREAGWRYFQSSHHEKRRDEWVVVRLPLKELQDHGEDRKFIWPGVKLTRFQIVLWGEESTSAVEVDWFEIGVEPDWESHDNQQDKEE